MLINFIIIFEMSLRVVLREAVITCNYNPYIFSMKYIYVMAQWYLKESAHRASRRGEQRTLHSTTLQSVKSKYYSKILTLN